MITEDTIKRFMDLYREHAIIIVAHRLTTNYDVKVLAVKNGCKWDFTPAVIHLTGCKNKGLTARYYSPIYLLEKSLSAAGMTHEDYQQHAGFVPVYYI